MVFRSDVIFVGVLIAGLWYAAILVTGLHAANRAHRVWGPSARLMVWAGNIGLVALVLLQLISDGWGAIGITIAHFGPMLFSAYVIRTSQRVSYQRIVEGGGAVASDGLLSTFD